MMQFASAQVVKMIADKVLDEVMRQVAARQGIATGATAPPPPDEAVAAMVRAHLDRRLDEVVARNEAAAAQAERVDARLTRLERRWGWTMMLRIGSISALTLLIGVVLGVLARASGWL